MKNVILTLLFSVTATSLNAATFFVEADNMPLFGGNCLDRITANSPTQANCSVDLVNQFNGRIVHDGVARASVGSVGVSASALVDNTASQNGGGGSYVETFASFQDELSIGIGSGTLLLNVDVFGTQSTIAEEIFETTVNFIGGTRSITANLLTNGVNTNLLSETVQVGTGGTTRSNNSGSLGTTTVAAQFTGGTVNLNLNMFGSAGCFNIPGNIIPSRAFCSSEIDFFTSSRFVGATVLDANGDVVDTSIVATSGFDYLTGLDPHVGPQVVPLPAASLMLLSGLGAFAAIRRRALTKNQLDSA